MMMDTCLMYSTWTRGLKWRRVVCCRRAAHDMITCNCIEVSLDPSQAYGHWTGARASGGDQLAGLTDEEGGVLFVCFSFELRSCIAGQSFFPRTCALFLMLHLVFLLERCCRPPPEGER